MGLKTALKRPDLFYAYVGIVQVINTQENEVLSFNYGLQEATKRGNMDAVKIVRSPILISCTPCTGGVEVVFAL